MTQHRDESEPLRTRTPQEIARDGGNKGKPVRIPHERTGDDALAEWEKKHGNTNIPAYLRKGGKRTGRERFTDN